MAPRKDIDGPDRRRIAIHVALLSDEPTVVTAREGLKEAMGVDRLVPRRIYRRDKLNRYHDMERAAFDALMVATHLAHGEEIAERYETALHWIKTREMDREFAEACARDIAKAIDDDILHGLFGLWRGPSGIE